MLRTPSILGPLNSGFVPFSPAADACVDDEATEVLARAAAPAAEPVVFAPAPVWAPASSARIRIVEGLVVAAICGYFAFGLLRTLFGA
jgi:hypothetical protein